MAAQVPFMNPIFRIKISPQTCAPVSWNRRNTTVLGEIHRFQRYGGVHAPPKSTLFMRHYTRGFPPQKSPYKLS